MMADKILKIKNKIIGHGVVVARGSGKGGCGAFLAQIQSIGDPWLVSGSILGIIT